MKRRIQDCVYYVHRTAVIGEFPEHRDWKPTDRLYQPQIEAGARIEALVTVDSGTFRSTKIGARTWLMKKVHVGHDAIIGEDCEIAPLTSVGGEVEIGNGVKVGQSAVFKPQIKVGDGARIGMGAVVTKDVPAGETWVGNPARPLRKAEPLPPPSVPHMYRDNWGGKTTLAMPEQEMTESELAGWEELAEAAERRTDDELYGEWWDESRAV